MPEKDPELQGEGQDPLYPQESTIRLTAFGSTFSNYDDIANHFQSAAVKSSVAQDDPSVLPKFAAFPGGSTHKLEKPSAESATYIPIQQLSQGAQDMPSLEQPYPR
jgi:hypothetical protein